MVENDYLSRLLPVLVHIQNHLDEDLSLDTMAALANFSSYHFHRVFRDVIGETLKQYTGRLRLERAAGLLHLSDGSVLDIALDSGFAHHETFTRAFKKHFGQPPERYRDHFDVKARLRQPTSSRSLNADDMNFKISKPRFLSFRPMDLAFIRNLGPYTDVDTGCYDQLMEWSLARDWWWEGAQLIGIGHDAPNVTPPEKLRFDACIQVPEPFQAMGNIAHQTLPQGLFGVTTYIGPYGKPMEQAYGAIFANLFQQSHYEVIGLPVVEIYRTTRITPDYQLNHTDICVPVRKKQS